jgi:hypothetical protein
MQSAFTPVSWPSLGGPVPPRCPPDQIERLTAFRRDHPEIKIAPGEFGTYHADVRLEDGSEWHVAEHDLGKLLDQLEDHVASSP